ncbi:hypothetical protein V474_07550 [Novosphingobium barchaimii LL02]|uniref:Uncharacterized protein n=1 Tax=Novosphingobium barchaimii LL02 TaxID=1114963 RepID=A0A0J7Y8L7_9SPHN|nr:hypothetical protein [Novosphingobium barchaimii]KMS59957.1 hypothetical protein V474_07550 [Novosphingobium barchaimii LL02]
MPTDKMELMALAGDHRAAYCDPDDIIQPALDLPPWPKPCGACAFLPHDPQLLGAETVADLTADVIAGEVEFYCAHRTTKHGLHRVCCNAAALAAQEKGEG